MRLREMSFTSTKSLLAFVNYKQLVSKDIQGVFQNLHPNANFKLTLLFWDDKKKLPPLRESDPIFEERENVLEYDESWLKPIEIEEDITEANVAYSKMNVLSEDAKKNPEKMSDYLDRKDRERERLSKIRSARHSLKEDSFERQEKAKCASQDLAKEAGSQEQMEFKWNKVKELWSERYSSIPMDIAFGELRFKGNVIYMPMQGLSSEMEGSIFYRLNLLIEEVFGERFSLEYL